MYKLQKAVEIMHNFCCFHVDPVLNCPESVIFHLLSLVKYYKQYKYPLSTSYSKISNIAGFDSFTNTGIHTHIHIHMHTHTPIHTHTHTHTYTCMYT